MGSLRWNSKRNNTKISLPGGDLPIRENLTDSTVIDYVFGNARLPMSIWRENKRTIHHDNPIKVLRAILKMMHVSLFVLMTFMTNLAKSKPNALEANY